MEQSMFDELVQGIIKVLRGNVVKIVLYGSVARGTQSSESDIDIAIFLLTKMDTVTEDLLSDVIVDMNLKYDKVFSVVDINDDVYRKWQNTLPFYQNVEKEGIVLWKAA